MAYTPKTNWQKGEVLEAADMNRVEGALSDVYTRLDTAAATSITLKAGLQTITSDRDKPFNLTSVRGRLLLNLLGRAGNFETLTGWTAAGITIAPNTANALYGSNCVQITLGSTTGRVSRAINTVSGRTYVVAVETRVGTATNARVDVTGQGNGNAITSTSGYQISYMRFTANAATHTVGITVTGANGQTVFADGFRVYEVSPTEYTAFTTLTADTFAVKYPYTEGLAGVKNPYAIRWTDSSKSQLAAMLAFDTELLANPSTDADAETEILYVGSDGQYYKTSIWVRKQLNGMLNWTISASLTGFKEVKVIGFETYSPATVYPIKYDGTVMQNALSNKADVASFDSSGNFYLTATAADTGWGDNYTPTNDEIRAYFYGYKMYDSGTYTAAQAQAATSATYNGSGTKQWVNLVGSPSGASLPVISASNFMAYELMYRRAISIAAAVASEGALSLAEGNNIIEIGSGLILRESARMVMFTNGNYYINSNNAAGSNTSRKPRKILAIYRNNRDDIKSFAVYTDGQSNGITAEITPANFDPNGSYSISYFDTTIFPTSDIKGATQDNERAIITDLVRDLEQVTRRVSANELRKAEKGFSANWTAPSSLLNGWSNFGGANEATAAYRKDDKGMVYMRGLIKDGSMANGTMIFRLPEGYRPSQNLQIPATSRNSTGAFQSCTININTLGEVRIENALNYWLTLVIPPFVAEL
ncbi:hypothetical protein [Paenibacillus hunanensis]|uniref:Tail fiber protein n=1 Tax=Paenibacillus hunanensis TaxID=539262 RepID=A0ABU1IV65_9BACL|nr:hypothetical protein [Paenibacillus hunanensis]MDR6243135.1 hypothetical protein [Paenibacillus hunanensis]GGJ11564.1 hypothetical protein GCM10008022_20900 [Paenibacillus hunanensis]